MSEALLTINILILIFYLFVDKLKIKGDLKEYTLWPFRICFGILAIVDLLVLFKVLNL